MNNKNGIELNDEVKVIGRGDDIFLVKGDFKQLVESGGREHFQMWYSLKNKDKGWMIEAAVTSVVKVNFNVDVLLDEIISLKNLENVNQDGRCTLEIERIIEKMKYAKGRQHG